MLLVVISRKMLLLKPQKDDIVFFLGSEKDSESFWKYVNRRKLVG